MPKKKVSVVKVVHPSYQPSSAELQADLRVKATPKQAIKALGRRVKINYVKSPKELG